MGKLFAIILTTAIIPQMSFAEVIKVPVGSQAADKQHLEHPRNGQSRASVEAKFGAPQAITEAVGEPPISSWTVPILVCSNLSSVLISSSAFK